jgi:murein DD-endopeptidase MepM/ murein hydrolase activator NlpD
VASLGAAVAKMAATGQGPSLAEMVHEWAPKFGVDPVAALQVSAVEGGGRFGAVGDQGTSFGPWQLHIGGAMPAQHSTPTAAAAFANSEEGVKYVLQQMGKVAGGLTGRQAIEAIVRKFERPAAPEAEIQRALGAQAGGAGAYAAPGAGPGLGGYQMGLPQQRTVKNPFAAGLAATGASINQNLAALMGTDPAGQMLATTLASQRAAMRPFVPTVPVQARRSFAVMTGQAGGEGTPAPDFSPTWLQGGFKLIGTPYQGTHTVGNWQSDNAVDVSMPVGTPIYAPVSGKLGNTGLLPGAGPSGGGRFAGERVNLYGDGEGFYFAHLSQLAPGIKQGAAVKKGQLLGYSGAANGVAHLHFGVEKGDPRSYYAGKQ